MNAQQLIKLAIIEGAIALYDSFLSVLQQNDALTDGDDVETTLSKINEFNIDAIFEDVEYDDAMQDARSEMRNHCDSVETNLRPTVSSRNYEVEVVAMKIHGQWVSWNYLTGGGKHGEPEFAHDWIEGARIVHCEEEQVMMTKRTFSDIETA